MLTREQATMIINQYATNEGTFIFNFSFPLSVIPKDLEMENLLFLSALDVEKDEFSYDIQEIIYEHLVSSQVIRKKWNHIEYRNNEHLIHLKEYINFLENYQNQYNEMEKQDDVELKEMVNVIEKIKKFEYKLIDEAEILIKIKEDIDRCVLKWRSKLSNKNYWEGV